MFFQLFTFNTLIGGQTLEVTVASENFRNLNCAIRLRASPVAFENRCKGLPGREWVDSFLLEHIESFPRRMNRIKKMIWCIHNKITYMNSKAAVNESDQKMNRWRKEILLFTWPVSLTRIGSLLQMLLEARFSSMHFSLLLAPMQILAPMYCTFLIHFSLLLAPPKTHRLELPSYALCDELALQMGPSPMATLYVYHTLYIVTSLESVQPPSATTAIWDHDSSALFTIWLGPFLYLAQNSIKLESDSFRGPFLDYLE